MRHRTCAVVVSLLLAASSQANAAYLFSLLSEGLPTRTVLPGDTFDLEIALTSDGSDVHNSAIYRVVFSAEGLSYDSYLWGGSYGTGTVFDDSKPLITELPLALSVDSLSGVGYPAGVVDVEMANVLAAGSFGTGLLATMSLSVPLDYSGPDTIAISVEPDTIAHGFDEVDADAPQVFQLKIPEPATGILMLAFGIWLVVGRKH